MAAAGNRPNQDKPFTSVSNKSSSRRNSGNPNPERWQQRIHAALRHLFAHRYGIGPRLLLLIVLFSSVVTLAATMVQLYLDFQRDVDTIEHRMDDIKSGYLNSISAGLWDLDVNQLKLQLEGIKRLPDIQAVELTETESSVAKPLTLSIGEKQRHAVISREFPILYSDNGRQRQLGILHVEATLTEVYQRLFDKAVVILLTQGIKTFLVSMFILYIFHRLVTRHLFAIAEYVSKFKFSKNRRQLVLNRKPPRHEDELEQMVDAFNAMWASLSQAYDRLRAVNAELEKDIIARREAEKEVKRLNAVLETRVQQRTAELEAANKELGAFCYSVSHDLRAPLRRIEGFRRILNEQYTHLLDAQGLHYLHRIEAGTHEMADMIDSFLRLSRSTRGELTVQQFNLSKLVETIDQRLREKEPQRKVEMKIDPDIHIEGDRRLLDLLLTNLLENAWKYTGKRQTAIIHFGRETSDTGKLVYFVQDNGAGFDMTYSERLFTPFSRLHRADEFDGTGIGLATAQRIVARHGGGIWAKAAPDQGAIFYFTFWDKETKS